MTHSTAHGRTALVLGGGGVTGISWEIGVLHGLAHGDLADLATAPDVVIGTSAGSVVGVHVAGATDLDELYAAQWVPASAEVTSPVDVEGLLAVMAESAQGARDELDARQRMGVTARTVADDDLAVARRAAVAARLPSPQWPPRTLRLTAVDVDSGEVVVFDRSSGVALTDAVAASCAVPGVWPTVEIGGRSYMDGGAASTVHATLAAGYDRVLVIAPFPDDGGPHRPGLDDEVAGLRAAGAEVTVVGPDPEYLAGPGATPLDPAGRPAAAEAGYRFGRRRP